MRVLVATTNIAAHAAGPLPLVRRLVQRGHEVRWYAGAAYEDAITSVGATRIPVEHARDISGDNPFEAFPELRGLNGVRQIREAFARMFIGLAPGQVQDLQEALVDYPADVVISDPLLFAAGFVAELGGPPWATISDSMLAMPSRDTAPFGPGIPPLSGPLGRLRNRLLYTVARRVLFRRLDEVHNRVRADVGLAPAAWHVMDRIGSPQLYIHPGVPSFEYPRSDLPPQVRFVGPFIPETGPWTPPSWWSDLDGRQVVHVTQGTISNEPAELLLPTLQGLANEDVIVVATTGGPTAAEVADRLGGSLPSNARVAPFVPYAELLRRASAFITNGGYTGVNLALAHGVPIVQAGVTEEKKEIAARIRWAGVGLALGTSTPSPKQVRKALRRVLDEPRFAAAAGRVRDDMASHDGPNEAADLLEELAARRQVSVTAGR
jgi:UDP:flavonoid glycosyltransferase YjiC (YdhE family)